jgi:aromatic ring-opening dioxygenase LigB subunit
MADRVFRYEVHQLLGPHESELAFDTDGDRLVRAGLTQDRVLDAALEAAQEAADRTPGETFVVIDRHGVVVREVAAVAACPF